MAREKYIRASDIGAHAFCARALCLKDRGAPSTLVHAQQQGIAYHKAHGAHVQSSVNTRRLSTLLVVVALILLVLAFLFPR